MTDRIIKTTFGALVRILKLRIEALRLIIQMPKRKNIRAANDIEAKHDRHKMKRTKSWDKDASYTGTAFCGIQKPLEDTRGRAVGLRYHLRHLYNVWQKGLEGVKAARAFEASSKATDRENLVSWMHGASLQKGRAS